MPDFGDVGYDRPGGRYEYQGAVNPDDPSVANGRITPEQWAAYKARERRNALLGYLGVLGAATGLGAAGAAFGGGAGVGAAGSASVPGAVGATAAPLGVGTVTAPLAATPFTSLVPYAAPVAATGTGIGIGAGAGVGAGAGAGAAGAAAAEEGARRYLGLTPRDWLAVAGSGAGTIGALTSDRPNFNANTATNDPNIQRLLQSMQRRLDKSEPLYESVLDMANGLLPVRYQKGGGGVR